MTSRAGAVLGSAVFFVIAPGTVAGWIPYLLSRWRVQPPLLGLSAVRPLGGVILAVGLVTLVACFAEFALRGRGTPAPIAPTESLVVSGLYRYVRNPMYVAVVSIVLGQALLFGNLPLLQYAGIVWLTFHAFVLLYEEPTLQHQYGASYETYRTNVRRWWPRARPWTAHDGR